MEVFDIMIDALTEYKDIMIVVCIAITIIPIWLFEREVRGHERLRDELKKALDEQRNKNNWP